MKSALRETYELIKNADRWCQGHAATNVNGFSVEPKHPEARRWCAVGAMWYVGVDRETDERLDTFAALLFPEMPNSWEGHVRPLVWVNDNLGHAAVMQVFEKALVETEGSL